MQEVTINMRQSIKFECKVLEKQKHWFALKLKPRFDLLLLFLFPF